MPKLFVSHATADKPLIKAFVELVEGGIGVPASDIFFTSSKEQGIRPGKDFKESIRAALGDSACVVALVSENFYASPFCMCELGGVWLAAKDFLPILVPPIDFNSLKGVLEGMHVSKLAASDDLDQLRDEIATLTGIKPHGTARWTERRDRFLSAFPDLIKSIKVSAPVPRETHEKLLHSLADYKKEYEERGEEVERLQNLNADLVKAKDRADVAKIVRAHSTTADTFEGLVATANAALKRLPRIVREACYYQFGRSEDYWPEREDSDDVQKAVEEGHLTWSNEGRVALLDEKDPKAKVAIETLTELSSWLDEPPEDFEDWYSSEYDGVPELARRPFWDEHLPR